MRIACPIRKISWRRIAGDDPRDKQIICSSPTTDSRRVRPVDGDRVGGRWGAPRRPVGILCPNAPEFLRALFAVHHTGAAACPLPLPFGLRELTETELLATCVTTVVAGHETTANLVSGGLLALMRDPAQLALLRERPGLIPSAVDELLRMKPPVQMTTRTTLRDTTLAGQELPADTGVVVLINSANRDPDVYPDPDRLDVTRYHDRHRPPARHLGYSLGIHYCLGAPLASLEMEVLLGCLLRRVTTMRPLTDTPPYKPNLIVRGLAVLPVAFEAR